MTYQRNTNTLVKRLTFKHHFNDRPAKFLQTRAEKFCKLSSRPQYASRLSDQVLPVRLKRNPLNVLLIQ